MADASNTLEEIAGSLVSINEETTSPKEGEKSEDAQDDLNDLGDDLEDDSDDLEEDQEGIDTDDTSEDVEDEEDADDNISTKFLDVSDDDEIEVKIDGKVEKRTIADAKKALSAEGAIQKRLKEAADSRNEANASLQKSQQTVQEQVGVLQTVLGQMGKALFTPKLQPPKEELISTNPAQYQRQKAMYDNEVQALNTLQQQFGTMFQQVNEYLEENKETYKKDQSRQLASSLPDLTDPDKAPKIRETIFSGAAHYGFTKEEIAATMDHRLFLMAYDAARYRDLQGQQESVDTGKRKRKPRTLRSGTTNTKTKARSAQKRRDAATQKAKTTGRPEDVAATLLKPQK